MKGIGMNKFSGISVAVALLAAATLAGCPPVDTTDSHTQEFAAGDAATNLAGKQIYYMTDGSVSFYSRTVISDITALPVTVTANHTTIDFAVDGDPVQVNLAAGSEVNYYGRTFSTLFIGSNGTVAFGAAGTGNDSLTDHFSSDQISLLSLDASSTGTVSYYTIPNTNETVVTFSDVDGDTVQLELFTTGNQTDDIAVAYPTLSADAGGVIGLSNGQLIGTNAAQRAAFFTGFGNGSVLGETNTGT